MASESIHKIIKPKLLHQSSQIRLLLCGTVLRFICGET